MRASSRQPPATTDPPGKPPAKSLPCKGLRSRAPPAAEKARRSRCSGRRAQACFSARSAMWAPQTGRWMRRKAQTEGCIAALPHGYPANPGSALPRLRRGRCLHRPGNPALPQTPRRQLPLQGSLLGENRLQSLPCKGRWMRRKAQTEGCIAALTHRYPANPGRALPRVRRGRCSHRPANPAMPQTPGGGRKRPPYKAPASG